MAAATIRGLGPATTAGQVDRPALPEVGTRWIAGSPAAGTRDAVARAAATGILAGS
ncbi:MAG: hypothetical protein Q4P15_11475 [Propionibacteriaceae bacterium]|nr:hypothetical protein [Propionibacteriaceae bacterium]